MTRSSRALLAAAVMSIELACSSEEKLAAEGGACSLTTDCQEGLVCVKGRCSSDLSGLVPPPEDAGGTQEAAPPRDGASGDGTKGEGAPPQDSQPPDDTGGQDASPPQDSAAQDTSTQDTATQDAGGGDAATD